MVSINPGELREKVQFYSITRTPDGAGGHTAAELLFLETLASVKPMRSIRSIESARLVLMQPCEVIIRYRSTHTPEIDMLFKYRNQTYTVKEITEVDVMKSLVKLVVIRE